MQAQLDYLTVLYERVRNEEYLSPKVREHAVREISLDELASILDSTIVEDRVPKLALFIGCLCTYTDESQLNFAFEAVSSAGKSHVALEVIRFFPKEDRIELTYASPKSFFHQHGALVRGDGLTPLAYRDEWVAKALMEWIAENPQPPKGSGEMTKWTESKKAEKSRLKGEWNKIPKGILVDLRKKILVFIDAPHAGVLTTLRPMLSRDGESDIYRSMFADKDSGVLSTKTVFLRGYPTVVHLSASFRKDEQESTRMFLLSVGVNQSKLEKTIEMVFTKGSNRDAFREKLKSDPRRAALSARVLMLKDANIEDVIITDEDRRLIHKRFRQERPHFRPRHNRDSDRLISAVKGLALLNWMNREKVDNKIVATRKDAVCAYELYSQMSEANELGISPALLDFWKETLQPALDKAFNVKKGHFTDDAEIIEYTGITKQDFRALWWQHFGSRLSTYAMKDKLEMLESVDFIEIRTDSKTHRLFSRQSNDTSHAKSLSVEKNKIDHQALAAKFRGGG